MLWLLIPSHLLFGLGCVLVYRKHRDKIEAIRAQAEIVADKLKG